MLIIASMFFVTKICLWYFYNKKNETCKTFLTVQFPIWAEKTEVGAKSRDPPPPSPLEGNIDRGTAI